MKGAQDRKQKNKKQDLQVPAPYPGYLGRVINMFDLGNGVVATKMLTERAHRDVSPAGKDRSGNFKMGSNQFPAQLEDKQRDGQLRRTSPTKRSNSPTNNRSGVAPVKMLMEQDMWREGASDDEPMNVVARLMGLNDAPGHQSDLMSARRPNKEYHQPGGFGEKFGRNVKPKKESRCYQNQKAAETWHEQTWGGLGDHQPSKIKSRHNQGNEPSCDKRMSLVREKFAEAKRLATDEKLLHSKEFQEALQFLSSNKDMFLKFLDEPSPLLSNSHYGFEPVTPPSSEVKQITILKPSESMKRKGNIHVARQLYSDGSETEGNRCRHHQGINVPPVNSTLPEPTRIVVLKPGLGKPHEDMIPVSSLASSTEPDSEDDSMLAVDDAVSSRRLAKEITWQMRMRLKDSQDEDNSLSYEYHDTYIEDGSFSKSEIENAKEVSGEISEDLEFGTPTSGRSWEFMSRSDSPYSASCSSQASNRREPSVVREAKRRILERWSVVSSTVGGEEERGARRSTGTLGEMLTIPEGKKDQEFEFGGITVESTTPELDTGDPFSCLPRSRSLPLSLSYGGRESNRGGAVSQEAAASEKSRKLSSFREKVSSLFSKNKKSAREKLDPCGISSANDTLTNGSAVTTGDGSQGSSYFTLDHTHNLTLVNTPSLTLASTCHTNDVDSLPAKDICPLPSLDSLGIFGESQEQPSPVSVLDPDGPFLCDNNRRLLYSSENFVTASSHALSRSPLIGSFSRSLSWEDSPPQEVMSPNSLRLSRLFSKADEDQDSLTFIQKLVSSAGMDRRSCVLLASPLDPKLLVKLSGYQGEGFKSRERRSREKLLFDAVNEALTELTWTTQLSSYPWGRTSSQQKECDDGFCNPAADEIWQVIRGWSILDRYPPSEVIERNLLLDMILKRELVETASADTALLETFEINTMVCAVVLEDLLEEALVDLI